MSMWTRKKEQPQQPQELDPQSNQKSQVGTIDFDEAAARTTAQSQEQPTQEQPQPQSTNGAPTGSEKLFVPDVVANGLSKALFLPGQKWIHPDMGLTDAEVAKLNPQSRIAIQWAADKILPAFLLRIANSASPVWDFVAAVAVLYATKYEEIQKQEAARVDNARPVAGVRVDEPAKPEVATSHDDLPIPGKPFTN